MTLAIIVLLLYLHFRNLAEVAIQMASLPFWVRLAMMEQWRECSRPELDSHCRYGNLNEHA